MKLNDLIESLDTKFDSLDWSMRTLDGQALFIGKGVFQTYHCTLNIVPSLSHLVKRRFLVLNFSFDDEHGSHIKLQNHEYAIGLKLLSCITHAFIDQLRTEKILSLFSVYVMYALDNEEKRLSVYHRIARKIAVQLHRQVVRHEKCVVVFTTALDSETVVSAIEDVLNDKLQSLS